jgi:hypothetical protein
MPQAFDHAAHLALALDYLRASPSFDDAAAQMAQTLRRTAAAAGAPEKYHHTVTLFWMRMLARLLDKELPLAYYSSERLFSDAARFGWVEPDLRPLDDHGAATGSTHSPGDAPDRPVSRGAA